jgi:hypothetical protein
VAATHRPKGVKGSALTIWHAQRRLAISTAKGFAMFEVVDVELIARVCHEANRGYCRALGDNSQQPWNEAPSWQRDSAVAGVKFLRENPTAKPSASHESWLEHKRREGWKYGPVKDEVAKEHPCFVPYDELPTEQKAKDYIFGAVARSLLET